MKIICYLAADLRAVHTYAAARYCSVTNVLAARRSNAQHIGMCERRLT